MQDMLGGMPSLDLRQRDKFSLVLSRLARGAARAAIIACLFVSGCLTAHCNVDYDADVRQQHILSRCYVVAKDTTFAKPTVTVLPLTFGRPATGEELILAAGTIIRTEHVERFWRNGFEGAFFDFREIQARVLTGPHRDERVGIDPKLIFGEMVPVIAVPQSSDPEAKLAQPLLPLPVHFFPGFSLTGFPPNVPAMSTEDLSVAATDSEFANRFYAICALARRTPTDAQAILVLGRTLNDEISQIRGIALVALARCGPKAASCLDVLLLHLNNPDLSYEEQDLTERALAAIGPAAYERVVKMLDSPDPQWVRKSIYVLNDAPPRAAKAQVPAMRAALLKNPYWIRDQPMPLLDAISRADPLAALELVYPHVRSMDAIVCRDSCYRLAVLAGWNLRFMGDKSVRDAVVVALQKVSNDANPVVRANVQKALEEIADDDARAAAHPARVGASSN